VPFTSGTFTGEVDVIAVQPLRTTAAILVLAIMAVQAQAGVISSHSGSFEFDKTTVIDTVFDFNAVTKKSPNELILLPMFDSSLAH
jgi:hypothetical protein